MHPVTAGLEVHQQLNTKKLFCGCPAVIRDDKPDFIIERELRATAGESGHLDVAAKAEQQKGKRFHYHGYEDSTCLIELDEEPVTKPNNEAFGVALQVAKLLKLQLVDEVHVMRKTVVDGSNTSGFQRTMLIGVEGEITVSGKKIRIEQLCLEEDSCKIIERKADTDVYNLSRLGIPLLEITTGPDLHSPEQVKEVAAYIGMLLRSTEAVKRGLGTIRQDVNVSVPGGERVEIKGAQDLDSISIIVENEAERQRALINLAQIIPAQAYTPIDVSKALASTQCAFVAKAIKAGGKAIGIKLTNWNEALETTLMPGMKLGRELAGYAKAGGFGGLIHSAEELSKYPISAEEQQAIRDILACSHDDSWLLMVGDEQKLLPFIQHTLIPRLKQFSVGVPKEVRKAEGDGTNSYLRPMPGASRMYPETDVRPLQPDTAHVTTPELINERSQRLQKQYKVSKDLTDQIAYEGLSKTFEHWAKQYSNVQPSTIAGLLVSKEKEIKTRHNIEIDITEFGPSILEKLNSGAIAIASVEEILVKLARREPIDFASYTPVNDSEIRTVLQQLVKDNPGASIGLLMGKAMRHFENKVDGKLVQQQLKELMQ